LLLIRSPVARGFLDTPWSPVEPDRFGGGWLCELMVIDRRWGFGEGGEGEGGRTISGKSNNWWVGRQSWSFSEAESGLMRILSILAVGIGWVGLKRRKVSDEFIKSWKRAFPRPQLSDLYRL